jgi:hypothetical protein
MGRTRVVGRSLPFDRMRSIEGATLAAKNPLGVFGAGIHGPRLRRTRIMGWFWDLRVRIGQRSGNLATL